MTLPMSYLITIGPGPILNELVSWGAYLNRGTVLLQLLVVGVVMVAEQRGALRRSVRHRLFPEYIRVLIGPLLLLISSALFLLAGLPWGLLRYFGLLWLGWMSFTPLKTLLLNINKKFPVNELESTFLRPVYVIVASLSFVRLMGSTENLSQTPIANLFGVELTLGRIYLAVIAIYVIITLASRPATFLAWLSGVLFGVRPRNRRGLELLFRYSVIIVGVIAVAYYIGIDGTAFIAIAGGLSVGIGFGVKEIVSNFISGIWLLFEGSVRPGEILMINGDPCTVRNLRLRATQLRRGRDGAELLIPNQTFFTTEATSFTATETSRRDSVVVGAAYDHDPDMIVELLKTIAKEHKKVLEYPPVNAFVIDFADSSINYKLCFWVANPLDSFEVGSDLRRTIWKQFEQKGITIPFPQRQVYPMEWPPNLQQSLHSAGGGGVIPQGIQPELTGSDEKPNSEA
ncbi:mechanosensitive ion channel protein [Synechococcus sp. WH 8020]|uniref:mechanosensitive ion channel family protein n=1 Tax=unclassified Synechococcus TaxID=2626047 RepID=UPI0006528114|nr:mechanosensitive ion channel domain-containing protein [Synechococcus sp. WH 8020]AKN61479.1 mechanosensitive ion channel protein [Synechococcus sp. WH 8020]